MDWRNGDWTAQIAISVIVIWRWTGYNALIYLAGMQSISQDLYEAAALDGASRWQQFLHVTLPGLRPTILFTIVVSTIGASQLFGEPLLFGGGQANGGPVNQYQTLGLFMYQQGWQFGQLGRAATAAVPGPPFTIARPRSLVLMLTADLPPITPSRNETISPARKSFTVR